MKIGLITNGVAYSSSVREKQELRNSKRESGDAGQTLDHSPGREGNDHSSDQQNEQELKYAMAEFRADQDAKANGLTASLEGAGPGLRVILRDGEGHTVRQLSGEEFLKLRHSLSTGLHVPGKILDQKL
jgi:hypothetical protein